MPCRFLYRLMYFKRIRTMFMLWLSRKKLGKKAVSGIFFHDLSHWRQEFAS